VPLASFKPKLNPHLKSAFKPNLRLTPVLVLLHINWVFDQSLVKCLDFGEKLKSPTVCVCVCGYVESGMGGSRHQTAGAEYSGPDSSAITEQARGRRTVPVGSRRATATSLRSLQGRTNSQRHARRMLSHAGITAKYYH